ncbi:MAG: RHS repeat-associated core domain-containing protein, partial [Casimicrobiaceae bacterium]
MECHAIFPVPGRRRPCKLTAYTYDALGRTTHTGFADGQAITLTYDTATHGAGKLAAMADPSGSTTYTYDSNGRAVSKTQVAQGITLPLTFGRDAMGRITSVVYPSGKTLAVTYAGDRISALSWNGATVISGIGYFPFGGAESWLFGGSTAYARATDLNGRTAGYTLPAAQRTITYDAAGRITQIGDGPSHNQNFTYDADSQLLTFSGFTSALASETRAYAYDANGNRTSANVNGVPATYSYTPNTNRLTSVSGLYTNSYDAAGNLTSDGHLTHTYDARGRLVQTTTPGDSGISILWTYNGLGQPTSRQDGADDTGHGYGVVWLYDDAGHMLGEYAYPGGAAVQEFIWLGDTLAGVAANIPVSCQTPPCTAYGVGYIWTDHLNAPRAITNSAGSQVWQWDSAPFGETLPNQNPAGLGTFTLQHRLPGQYANAATHLSQNGARTYDSALGRYIQSDPIGLAGGAGTFTYTRNNPISKIDASGLDTYDEMDVDFLPRSVVDVGGYEMQCTD